MFTKEHEYTSDLKTFACLPRATYHGLTYAEQLVVIQNTALTKFGGVGYLKPLTIDQVDPQEVKTLHCLINPNNAGPFASTFFEGIYSWYRYLYTPSHETINAFNLTIDRGLWEKYVGMADWECHGMGEILHALNKIAEAYSPHSEGFRMNTPSDSVPSYLKALADRDSRFSNALFVGAMSPKSIADIYSIWKNLLPKLPSFEIVDLDGKLTAEAAKHYGINFSLADGFILPFETCSRDLVFTNYIINSMVDFQDSVLEHSEEVELRGRFFGELSRVVTKNGTIAMVEIPLFNYSSDNQSRKNEIAEDVVSIKKQLKTVGFKNIDIQRALQIKNVASAEGFVTTGELNALSIKRCTKNNTSLFITAKKG